MTDPLKSIIRSEEQKSFQELRSEFRETNRQRIARTLREDTITFRDAQGNYLRDQHGNVIERKTGYLTDRPAGQDHRRVDEWKQAGGIMPVPSNDFYIIGIDVGTGKDKQITRVESNGIHKEMADLVRDAKAMEQAEGVKHPEAPTMEGPALMSLEESSLLDYAERLVKDE